MAPSAATGQVGPASGTSDHARALGGWPARARRANRVDVAPSDAGSKGTAARRTCGLDLGGARVGVAIDDDMSLLAHPRGTLDARDTRALLDKLRLLADEENVGCFVVGLPLDMTGGEGIQARRARAMAQRIADATGRPVQMWDERLTTVQARRALGASEVYGKKARARVDEAAACAILQSWLDARRARSQR